MMVVESQLLNNEHYILYRVHIFTKVNNFLHNKEINNILILYDNTNTNFEIILTILCVQKRSVFRMLEKKNCEFYYLNFETFKWKLRIYRT